MADAFAIKGLSANQISEYLSTAVRNSAQSLTEAKNRNISASAAFEAVAAQAEDPAPEGLPASQYADLQKGTVAQAGFARLEAYLQYQRAVASHQSLLIDRTRLEGTAAPGA